MTWHPRDSAVKRHSIEHDNLSFDVYEAGPSEGRAVLFLHGYPDGVLSFRTLFRQLADQGFRCIIFDQRGYSSGARPTNISEYRLERLGADAIGIANAFNLKQFDLIAHDWGGGVGWWLAEHQPGRIKTYTAINMAHPALWRQAMTAGMRQALASWYVFITQIPWLPERMAAFANFAMLRWALRLSSRPGTFDDRDFDELCARWRQKDGLRGPMNWYRALWRHPPSTPKPQSIKPPVMILWGLRDIFLNHTLAEASQALCCSCHLETFSDLTHWPHMEQPDLLKKHIIQFLEIHRDNNTTF